MTPVGAFTVPPDHPSLAGHFPGRPIVPGVVLLDEVAALILASDPALRLTGFPAVRFTRPVLPGDIVAVAYGDGAFACTVGAIPVLRGTIGLS